MVHSKTFENSDKIRVDLGTPLKVFVFKLLDVRGLALSPQVATCEQAPGLQVQGASVPSPPGASQLRAAGAHGSSPWRGTGEQ